MTLSEFCQKITSSQYPLITDDTPLAKRLVCTEYSKSFHRVLPFTPIANELFFAMCWNFSSPCTLYSTMCPSKKPFYHKQHFISGQKTQLHTHDFVELGYIVKGSFRQKINNTDVTFREGEFYLIDKNCLHQDYLIDSNSIILFVGLEDTMLSDIMDEHISTHRIITFLKHALANQKELQQYILFRPTEGIRPKMEQFLLHFLQELHTNMIGSHYILKGVLLRIFQTLSTQYTMSLIHDQQATLNWIIYDEICNYINNNYNTISIEKLVEVFHFQEDYYNRLFKKKAGITYSEYVQNIRLKNAQKLILSTDKSISEIVSSIGYHNKCYFYKIFKERYGLTPQQYRQKYKE